VRHRKVPPPAGTCLQLAPGVILPAALPGKGVMSQRLLDYGTVLLVVAVLYGLFRLARYLLERLLAGIELKHGPLTSDSVLLLGFFVLLTGLLLLPVATWGLAFVDSSRLAGGLPLHLLMVIVSIILFSFAEDLFGSFRKYPAGGWRAGRHYRLVALPLLGFWALGSLLLSPIFYSGLTVILAVFYSYALRCRA
jgi:hypothetical protein